MIRSGSTFDLRPTAPELSPTRVAGILLLLRELSPDTLGPRFVRICRDNGQYYGPPACRGYGHECEAHLFGVSAAGTDATDLVRVWRIRAAHTLRLHVEIDQKRRIAAHIAGQKGRAA